MSALKKTIIRAGLETLYFSGAHLAMKPFVGGVGVILTLHHVRPRRVDAFQPNRLLEVAPVFFSKVISRLRRSGIDLVSLDEMHRRLTEQDFRNRRAKHIVYGHTHHAENVPLDASYAENYVLNHLHADK